MKYIFFVSCILFFYKAEAQNIQDKIYADPNCLTVNELKFIEKSQLSTEQLNWLDNHYPTVQYSDTLASYDYLDYINGLFDGYLQSEHAIKFNRKAIISFGFYFNEMQSIDLIVINYQRPGKFKKGIEFAQSFVTDASLNPPSGIRRKGPHYERLIIYHNISVRLK